MQLLMTQDEIPSDLLKYFEPVRQGNRSDIWTIPTESYKGAHFATFPRKIVEPCILAGTSAKGACPQCGAGWVRVVEKTSHFTERPGHPTRYGDTATMSAKGYGMPSIPPPDITTTGWRPTCDCSPGGGGTYDPIPCTVLDPFCGTATVGEVALQHNRSFIGIELSEDYIELARKRLHGTQLGLPMAL